MPRKVFFSFYYDEDIIRVSRIRQSGAFKGTAQPFIDKAEWESIKRSGDTAVKNWIDRQMIGTSVLVLCIGRATYTRRWVLHEIEKAYKEGRGIVGIYLNGMADFQGNSPGYGPNPLDYVNGNVNGYSRPLSQLFDSYSWMNNNGYLNLENWIEAAAQKVGR